MTHCQINALLKCPVFVGEYHCFTEVLCKRPCWTLLILAAFRSRPFQRFLLQSFLRNLPSLPIQNQKIHARKAVSKSRPFQSSNAQNVSAGGLRAAFEGQTSRRSSAGDGLLRAYGAGGKRGDEGAIRKGKRKSPAWWLGLIVDILYIVVC